jgi:hypothetical protein
MPESPEKQIQLFLYTSVCAPRFQAIEAKLDWIIYGIIAVLIEGIVFIGMKFL